MVRKVPNLVIAVFAAALLASCGSGFLTALADDSTPDARPLVVGGVQRAPLLVDPTFPPTNALSIANFRFDGQADRVRIELRALGVVDQFSAFSVESDQDGRTRILYRHKPVAIRDRVGPEAVHDADVPVQLAVIVDEREVVLGDMLLTRAPRFAVLNSEDVTFLSPQGARMTVSVGPIDLVEPDPGPSYLADLIRLNVLTAEFALVDDLINERVNRFAIEIASAEVNGSELILGLQMPPIDFPSQIGIVVKSTAGGSTPLYDSVFYEPFASGPSPFSGPTEGGTNVFLIGRAMAPRLGDGTLDFDAIKIDIVKGGQSVPVPPSDLQRSQSTSSVLSFQMPPSPDGRSGPATVRVRVTLPVRVGGSRDAITTSERDFFYGDSFPYFGPRGLQLREQPKVVRFAPVVEPNTRSVDAVSVFSGPAEMPFAAVYGSRGNGLFSRFGAAVRAGITIDESQRVPVDICIDQFFGEGSLSGVILNQGQDEANFARHALLEFNAGNPPLQFNENFRLAFENPGRSCAAADLNKDDTSDLVVISAPGAGMTGPVIFLSTKERQFRRVLFTSSAPGPLDFERVLIEDLDSDGAPDLVFALGGSEPRFLFAYGNGNGEFPLVDQFDFNAGVLDLPGLGYDPHPSSVVVGLHAVGAPGQRSVVAVFSGRPNASATPPAVIQLRPGANPRDFQPPTGEDLLPLASTNARFIDSAHGDLTGDGAFELVVVAADNPQLPILLYQRDGAGKLVERAGAMDYGPERIDSPRGVSIATAVQRGDHGQSVDRQALFVTHEQVLQSGTESRVSTYLSDPNAAELAVIPAAAGRKISRGVKSVVVGSFFPQTQSSTGAGDLWVATDAGLTGLANDGLGEHQDLGEAVIPGLLPRTLTRVAARSESGTPRDVPVFLNASGNLGVMLPSRPLVPVFLGEPALDLRSVGPLPLRGNPVQDQSRLITGDIDQDGIDDLVVLLVIPARPGEGESGEAVLLLLRGKERPAVGEFPYEAPVGQYEFSVTHGNASSLAAGDFVTSTSDNRLELAVAVPRGSGLQNEVRFYRWDVGLGSFVLSSRSSTNRVLPVGDEPTQLAAADFNGDGRTDLAVASQQDRNLWIVLNVAPPSESKEVDLSRFVLAPANPLPLPSGQARQIFVDDLSGDGVPDVTLVIESDPLNQQQSVVYYLSPGSLTGSSIRAVPEERTGALVRFGNTWGSRQAATHAGLGDLNGDGSPDLILGWDSFGAEDYNLRILFGNNL